MYMASICVNTVWDYHYWADIMCPIKVWLIAIIVVYDMLMSSIMQWWYATVIIAVWHSDLNCLYMMNYSGKKKHVFAFHNIFHHLRSKTKPVYSGKVHWETKFQAINEMIVSLYCTLSIMPQIDMVPSGCAIASQVLTKFVWNIASHERFVNPLISIIPVMTMALPCCWGSRGISQISWCFSSLTKITMPFGDRNLKRIA